jgi:hypothetical protein
MGMVEEPEHDELRLLVRLTIDTWNLLLPAVGADPDLADVAADEARRWEAAWHRLSAARDDVAAWLNELDEADIRDRIEESGAPPAALARFLDGATARGGLKALLTRDPRDPGGPGVAFLLDESAPCYLSLGLVAIGVLVAPKMPLLGGFAIGFGVTEAAATC